MLATVLAQHGVDRAGPLRRSEQHRLRQAINASLVKSSSGSETYPNISESILVLAGSARLERT